MHIKSYNIEIMICSVTDEIIEELFEYLLQGHQEWVEESMRGILFIFDSFDVLYCDLNGIRPYRGGSYKDSREWLINKKATRNTQKY